ncbi:flagellar biosynthesis protein FlhB [Acetobacteraceae bacterium H6797]|nr:flagellar biosynthesis protein FlhB [Acetobacteraceae bacterium H6797]
MAEEGGSGGDAEDKTEAPSQRRLDKAHEEGQFPMSREAVGFAVLGLAMLGTFAALPTLIEPLLRDLRGILARSSELEPFGALRALALPSFIAIAPVMALAGFGAIAATFAQSKGHVSAKGITPQLSKLSPLAGIKRIIGKEALIEFLKTLAKLTVVGLALWQSLNDPALLEAVMQMPIGALPGVLMRESRHLVTAALVAFAVIAALDLLWVRFQHHQRLRMSRHDQKEEMKESEGDPHVKGKQKQIRMSRARKRMMAAVPKATVVITNPTHYAVALSYEGGNVAPRIVAKGVDAVAARIRALAEEHGVPLVPNPPLARALYKFEIDTDIPPEHYQAVAEIIAFVWRLKGRAAGQAG